MEIVEKFIGKKVTTTSANPGHRQGFCVRRQNLTKLHRFCNVSSFVLHFLVGFSHFPHFSSFFVFFRFSSSFMFSSCFFIFLHFSSVFINVTIFCSFFIMFLHFSVFFLLSHFFFLLFFSELFDFSFSSVARADAPKPEKNRRTVPFVKMTFFFCEKRFLGLGGQGVRKGPFEGDPCIDVFHFSCSFLLEDCVSFFCFFLQICFIAGKNFRA